MIWFTFFKNGSIAHIYRSHSSISSRKEAIQHARLAAMTAVFLYDNVFVKHDLPVSLSAYDDSSQSLKCMEYEFSLEDLRDNVYSEKFVDF